MTGGSKSSHPAPSAPPSLSFRRRVERAPLYERIVVVDPVFTHVTDIFPVVQNIGFHYNFKHGKGVGQGRRGSRVPSVLDKTQSRSFPLVEKMLAGALKA